MPSSCLLEQQKVFSPLVTIWLLAIAVISIPVFRKRQGCLPLNIENIEPLADSPLKGKHLLFLGSSVTYGSASLGVSMCDYLSVLDGCETTIICYCNDTWDCPVIFYTGTKYDSAEYQVMVNSLLGLQEKWELGIIDLWNDVEMNAVSEKDYDFYMNDPIHPTQAGYLLWWTPKFESYLYEFLK